MENKKLKEYGYYYSGMEEISLEQAKELWGKKAVYCLYEDNTECLADTIEEMEYHCSNGGLLGIEKDDSSSLKFEDQLCDILTNYDYNWTNEPLDGDEVDKLVETLRNQLNLINGNITNEEYEKLELDLDNKGIKEKHICSLCGKVFYGMGNNPEPLKKYGERCCDECNNNLVIPKRIEMAIREKEGVNCE